MKITAKEFNNNPAQAYRAADKGEEVTITHDRYPDAKFMLVTWSEMTKISESFKQSMNAIDTALGQQGFEKVETK